jgi:hypothetical protein
VTDPWRDPTAVGAIYVDPTAPVFIAPVVLPEPDPVYRDDALFASASANWRPAPIPVPPIPVLDESGELILVPAPAPTPAMLRDQAVAALKAPPAHYQAPASRGGARSTYTAEPPPPPPRQSRSSRRPAPGRPAGSVTTSPSMYLPDTRTTPSAAWQAQPEVPTWLPNPRTTPTAPWQAQPEVPTWLPQAPGQAQQPRGQQAQAQRARAPQARAPQARTQQARAQQARAQQPDARADPGAVTYRASGRTPGQTRRGGRRRGSSKGWIPGLVVLAFVILANVVPHLHGIFHRGAPAGVDQAVNSYYTDVADHDATGAAALVCPSVRLTWQDGQAQSTSDTQRGILDHSVTSTSADGSDNYTVKVRLTLSAVGTGPTTATIKVLKQGSSFFLCGGTRP